MNIAIPFISHVERQITPEQALQIAQILGLPMELNFISLTIDESLNLRAFARGMSESQPFHWNSVPFNYLAYQVPPPPAPPVADTPPAPEPEPEPEPISPVETAIRDDIELVNRLRNDTESSKINALSDKKIGS